MPPSVAGPTEAQWESHKDAIRRLVLVEELSQVETVKALERRGFHVTETKLEWHLKKWNFRRRISGKAWEAIGHRISKRKADGQDSEVLISGVPATWQKVTRETKRFKPLIPRQMSPKLDADLPVIVRTPPASFVSLPWPESLPWFTIRDYFVLFDRLVSPSLSKSYKPSGKLVAQDIRLLGVVPTHTLSQRMETLLARINRERRQIPESDEGQPVMHDQSLADMDTGSKFRDLIKFLIFQLSNNLNNGPEEIEPHISAWILFQVLVKNVGPANLPILDVARSLTFRSFLESILMQALHGDPNIQRERPSPYHHEFDRATYLETLRWVFKCGLDPDEDIRMNMGTSFGGIAEIDATPLQVAVICRLQDVSELLIDCGANVDAIVCSGFEIIIFSPLELALGSLSKRGYPKFPHFRRSDSIIKLLLDRGAGREAKSRDCQLQAAIRAGNLEAARLLVEYGASLDFKLPYDDEYSVSYVNFRLYRHDHHPITQNTAFTAAAEFESHGSSGFNPVQVNESTTNSTTTIGETDPEDEVDPEDEGKIEDVVLKLLNALVEWLDCTSRRALRTDENGQLIDVAVIAASRGHRRVLCWLIEMGVDLGTVNSKGISPLLSTIAYGRQSTCQLLLDAGALDRDHGQFALHAAVVFHQCEILKTLISTQINIQIKPDVSELRSTLTRHDTPHRRELYSYREISDLNGTALYTALRSGCPMELGDGLRFAEMCKILIRAGGKLTGGELAFGVWYGDDDLIELALAAGASVNERIRSIALRFNPSRWTRSSDLENKTCLQIAISVGDIGLLRTILHQGARLEGNELFLAMDSLFSREDARDAPSSTLASNLDILSLLERYGADVRGRSANGQTCLEQAFSLGSPPLVNWALHHLPQAYDSGLLCAMAHYDYHKRTDDPRTLQFLNNILKLRPLQKPADPLETTAIAIAACNIDPSPVLELLLSHIPPSNECHLRLNLDLSEPHIFGRNMESLVKRDLLSETCYWRESNTIRASPLAAVALAENPDTAWLLLQHGFRPDSLALLSAVERGSLDMVDRFHQEGIKELSQPHVQEIFFGELSVSLKQMWVPAFGQYQEREIWLPNPILVATRNGDLDMVHLLLRHGHGVDDRPILKYHTPLQLAVRRKQWSMALCLLDAGADPNARTSTRRGATPLQYAAIHGNLEFARRLLNREIPSKINAHRSKFDGRTALEGAAEDGRLDMVELLLSYGAKISGSGQRQYLRAMRFAESNHHSAVFELLQRHRDWTEEDEYRYDHDFKHIGTTTSECSDSDCSEDHEPSWWKQEEVPDASSSTPKDNKQDFIGNTGRQEDPCFRWDPGDDRDRSVSNWDPFFFRDDVLDGANLILTGE